MPPPRAITRFVTWITAGSALAAVMLGFLGFSRLDLGHAEGMWGESPAARFFDRLYFGLSMLTLMARQTYGEPLLMAGRWFGVLFFFSAVLRVLLPQAFAALNLWQIRRMNGHTVVLGIGARGRAFLLDLARRGPVVGFDRRPAAELGLDDPLETLPIHLVQGEGTVRHDLELANVRNARRIVVCVGADAVNHAVAREVLGLLRVHGRTRARHDTPLDVIVPCIDQSVGQDLVGELDGAPLAHVRPFNLHASAARTLLLLHPWLLAGERLFERPRHWLFVGWDDYADALLVASQTLGAGLDGGAPSVTAFATEPAAARDRLTAKYPLARPQLQRLALGRLDALGSVSAEDFDAAGRTAPVGAIFVFGRDDRAAFSTARRIRRLASARGGPNVPVFVRMDDASAFDSGLKPLATVHALSQTVQPFGGLTEACSESALHDWEEMLARDVHEGYRAHVVAHAAALAEGGTARPASGRSWAEVGEALRASNRRAIDHLPLKLARLGLLVRGGLPLPRFALPLHGAVAARIMHFEHRSWIAERRFAGTIAPAAQAAAAASAAPSAGGNPGGAPDSGRDDSPQARHYEPFRALFDQPYRPSDPWLRDWIAARHHAGDGAWLERILTVVALPSLGDTANDLLETGLRSFLGEAVLDERLGNDGREYWTLVSTLDSRHDARLLRALLRVLGRTATGAPRSARCRVVVVRPAPERSGASPGSDAAAGAGLDAISVLGDRLPIDYLLELPRPVSAPGSAPGNAADGTAVAAMLAYMAGRSDETLVFGAASNDRHPGRDRPDGDSGDATAAATAATVTAAGRWVAPLMPLYHEAADRVIRLGSQGPR